MSLCQTYPTIPNTFKGKYEFGNAVLVDDSRLLHPTLTRRPFEVISAKGIELHLSNGQTIIDACGGAAVTLLGHGNEEVIAAMMVQALKVSYVHTAAYTTNAAEELANVILRGSPHGLEKAFFVGSGSEAMETAMKLARQYFYEKGETQRLHFVARKQGYHGNTIATMSVSSNLARKIPYHGLAYPYVSHVTPAFSYRYKLPDETETQFATRLVDEVEHEFMRIGPEKIIAFIAEPIVGATAGCVTPPQGYLSAIKAVCDKHGILLILDEVMCGTGRSGTFFAFEQEAVIPDIVAIGKGLGGGYAAIAGVLAHRRVVDTMKKGSNAFLHGHTYQMLPIACAAALAVQKILRRDGLVERCAKMGKVLERLLRTELSQCSAVGDIRGRGLFWAVEFVKDKETKSTFDPSIGFGNKVQQEMFKRGVAVYPGSGTVDGTRGDHILLAPPFTVTERQLETVCHELAMVIQMQEERFM